MDKRSFTDVKVGDTVMCFDEYTHDCYPHKVLITSIEYDKEYATKTNPKGKVCYCEDEEDIWGDEYIGLVHEGNFVSIGAA